MNNLSQSDLARLVTESLKMDFTKDAFQRIAPHHVVGSYLEGRLSQEREILNLSCARLGYSHVEFGLDSGFTSSSDEVLANLAMVSSAVDTMVTGFGEATTFGAGRQIAERLNDHVESPLVNLLDDIYAPQPALSMLASLWSELRGLQGKRITISWAFGSTFPVPRIPHSLLILGIVLGAEITVLNPPEFPLLRRIIKEAEKATEVGNGNFDEATEFDQSLLDVDAVVGLNWSRLDDFNHPEKNRVTAMDYRDWQFTKENIGNQSLFISTPPVQTDLLASNSLLHSPRNLTPDWLKRRTQVLAQSIIYVSNLQKEGLLSTLL